MNTQTNKISTELNLNKKEDFELYIDEMEIREVKEAVKYFQKRFRKTEDNLFDEFVLMHKNQVDLFKRMNTNPDVKIRVEYLDEEEKLVYCYILYRVHKNLYY